MLGFDDVGLHRRYWVNQFLDVTQVPDDELLREIIALRPMDELLEALHEENGEIRSRATQMLWHFWMTEVGELAYEELLHGGDLLEEERGAEAVEVFTQLLEQYPNFAEAYNKRATAHYVLGHYDESIRDCVRTLRLNPHHFGAWHGLGLCYVRLRKFDRGMSAFRQALKIQPFGEENVRLLAFCKLQLGGRQSPSA